jgi:hypothetical protein
MKNQTQADMILHNGKITTLDPDNPEAASLVVKDAWLSVWTTTRITSVDQIRR